jgi:hypothetical protein
VTGQTTKPAEPVATVTVSLPVVSEPAGATVSVDGVAVPGVTPLTIAIDPAREHRVTARLDGHGLGEIKVPAGAGTRELRLVLEPTGPPGRVLVSASYPVEVFWRGKSIAKAQPSPELNLPAGKQALTLVSTTHFLRQSVTVDVRAGATAQVEVPPLGRLSIRATPDNCQVFVDGTFVDFPPILDRAIVAGEHKVAFKWPDGARQEETVEVRRGAPSYVMGRKE